MDLDELYLSLHKSAKSADGGISGVAKRLMLREQVLLNKLNPNSTEAEPKLSEFVRVMRDIEAIEPLEILCSMFGGRFVTRSTSTGKSLMRTLLHAVNEMADIAKVGEKAMEDGYLSADECREWIAEIYQVRDALTQLENTIVAYRNGVADK
ncbi:MAG: phage regulatory CII family protein [Candidatus Thiodiazotropha taylori]